MPGPRASSIFESEPKLPTEEVKNFLVRVETTLGQVDNLSDLSDTQLYEFLDEGKLIASERSSQKTRDLSLLDNCKNSDDKLLISQRIAQHKLDLELLDNCNTMLDQILNRNRPQLTPG